MGKPATKAELRPFQRVEMNSAITRRALGRREARRLAQLMEDAEQRARARIEAARQEAEQIFQHARDEAMAILAKLPDFAALESTPTKFGANALKVIREVADTRGLPLAVVTGRDPRNPIAREARDAAICAVAAACPGLKLREIGTLFSISEGTVAEILKEQRP